MIQIWNGDQTRIEDLMVSALEGGSNYWYEISNHNLKECQTKYLASLPFQENGWIEIDDMEGELDNPVRIDRKKIMEGLLIFQEKCPRHYKDFLNENDDAETADCFLQCIVFGDVIFG